MIGAHVIGNHLSVSDMNNNQAARVPPGSSGLVSKANVWRQPAQPDCSRRLIFQQLRQFFGLANPILDFVEARHAAGDV